MLTKEQLEIVQEAFGCWLDTGQEEWTENGKHIDPEMQAIIDEIARMLEWEY